MTISNLFFSPLDELEDGISESWSTSIDILRRFEDELFK
jgi:hypothetical protein